MERVLGLSMYQGHKAMEEMCHADRLADAGHGFRIPSTCAAFARVRRLRVSNSDIPST